MMGETEQPGKANKSTFLSADDEDFMMVDIPTSDEPILEDQSLLLNSNEGSTKLKVGDISTHSPHEESIHEQLQEAEGESDTNLTWKQAIGSAIQHHIRHPIASISASTRALEVAINEHVKDPIGKALHPVGQKLRNQNGDNAESSEWKNYEPYLGREWFPSDLLNFGWGNGKESRDQSYVTLATDTPSTSPTPAERFKHTRSICIED